MDDKKTICRTPNANGTTRIPSWKFDVIREAILKTVDTAGEDGLAFKDLSASVASTLDSDILTKLGSVGWHTTCVKLELEVAGEIARVPGVTPQRIVRPKRP